jgi:hypothetical protein
VLEFPEVTIIDYKRDQYPMGNHKKKPEILKDISAMANNPADNDKFLIIGIKDGTFYDIDDPIDDGQYQQYIKDNIQPHINFEYTPMDYDGHKICVFRIFNNNNRPYLIKNKIVNSEGKVCFWQGDGFIRRGTSTDRLIRDDFERIYKKRYTNKDRKDDLKIITKWKLIEYDDFYKTYLYAIDMDLINESNQSIDITVEVKIKKSNKYDITTQDDLDRQEYERRKENSGYFDIPRPYMPGLNISMSENESEYVIRRGLRPKINLEQRESFTDIFFGGLFFSGYVEDIVGEIIVKSDFFTEGPKIVSIPGPQK